MYSDNEKENPGTASPGEIEIENVGGTSEAVDNMTERKLMRKLDYRIIPMIMWMYLMNFMDRVNIGNARLYGMEEDLNLTGSQYQLAVSILFVTYCVCLLVPPSP